MNMWIAKISQHFDYLSCWTQAKAFKGTIIIFQLSSSWDFVVQDSISHEPTVQILLLRHHQYEIALHLWFVHLFNMRWTHQHLLHHLISIVTRAPLRFCLCTKRQESECICPIPAVVDLPAPPLPDPTAIILSAPSTAGLLLNGDNLPWLPTSLARPLEPCNCHKP